MDREKDKVISLLQHFKEKIKEKIDVEKVIFFGSRLKGDNTADSDIDLLIVSSDFEGIKYFKRASNLYYIWDQPYDIDIICLTPDEVKSKQMEVGIVCEAVNEGISI